MSQVELCVNGIKLQLKNIDETKAPGPKAFYFSLRIEVLCMANRIISSINEKISRHWNST